MNLILQDSKHISRNEFYARVMSQLGVTLDDALNPPKGPTMINFQGKLYPLGSGTLEKKPPVEHDPFEYGFSGARCWAEGCLGWIWCQWLSEAPAESIRQEVTFVVNRGMEMQERCPNQKYRCLHDLWLLHCAILGASSEVMTTLAKRVVDSNGDTGLNCKHGSAPKNDGEQFAAAWCGMLKYWILGDLKKAAQESTLIWSAYRYDIARVAPKALVDKWLEGDWKKFAKLQQKNFASLWDLLRKRRVLVSESDSERVIDFHHLGVPGTGWCWAHVGLAMLAHRRGIEVVTDPFWFPPYALKCMPYES